MDYMFNNKPEFAEPIRVLFLCGVKFKDNETDKRIVLKNHLEKDPKNRVLILEKYFDFVLKRNSDPSLLSYHDVDLFNLHSIESFAALVATNVIIIHESLSTAGELGVFASDRNLRDRIITLVPDQFSVEEEKISGFLRLAFWANKERIINKNAIRFYPQTKRAMVSDAHSYYETYFVQNVLPTSLAKEVDSQLIEEPKTCIISVTDDNTREEKNSVRIYLNCDSIKNYLLAILSVGENRKRLRDCKKVYEIRNILSIEFTKALKNTYRNFRGTVPKSISVNIESRPDLTFENAISFMLYFFHACGIMTITCEDDKTISVSFPQNTSHLWKKYSELIQPITFAEWGE